MMREALVSVWRRAKGGRLFALAGLFGWLAVGEAGEPLEYQVKAAYLYNFALFVQWPESVFGPDKPLLELCVLGQDPFGQILDSTIVGKSALGRGFEIRRGASMEELGFCHILYIGSSEAKRLPTLLRSLARLPVLTVSDMENFAGAGGIIGFVLERNKVHFEINAAVAKSAGLKISSKLLQLARIVETNQE